MTAVNPAFVRRATSAAQAVLKEKNSSLIVDGKPGTFTFNAYNASDAKTKADVDQVVTLLGIPGGMRALHDYYVGAKAQATNSNDAQGIFDLQVVPALIRGARQRGIDPFSVIAQIALESNWGKSTPKADDGSPSYNYGGIKWAALKTPKQAHAKTGEVIGGKAVKITDSFAVFDTPAAFADGYFHYLLDGPSSYRYKGLDKAKSAYEYGAILQKGGYATDPQYATKFAAIAKSAEKRYA